MTVATQVLAVQGIGTGATRTFSFSPLVIFAASELVVVTSVIATGVETVRTLGTGTTNFSVNTTTFPGTGSIQYPASGGTLLETTDRITILRVLVLEQDTNLVNQGAYLPEVQESQFDKLLMIDQQQQDQLDRGLRVQRSELRSSVDAELPSLIGNESKYIRVNSDGDGFDLVALSGVTGALSSDAGSQVVVASPSSGSSDDIARADHTHQTPDIVLVASYTIASLNFS